MKAITRSYLTKIKAFINSGDETRTVGLTRRCSQGSRFVPVLWNVTMEQLLKTELPRHANIQAYVDDIALSVSGKSRKELHTRTSEILNLILQWETERKLTFSSAKSMAVPFKCDLVSGFTVEIILNSKLTFKDHVTTLRAETWIFSPGWEASSVQFELWNGRTHLSSRSVFSYPE